MKRILALLLALCSLLLASCSQGLEATTEEQETKEIAETKKEESEEKEEEFIPTATLTDKLSWEKINAFPKANENMTPEEARELCVSFFRFCQSFAWTPDQNFSFQRNAKGAITDLKKGTVYGGLPYGGVSTGTIYRLMEVYNTETGVVKMKEACPGGETLYFANQCSLGAYQAWGRVINSPVYTWTQVMVEKRGFIPVGPYTYDKSISAYSENYQTTQICQENGEQVMYRSYAAMQPADGLVYYTTAGHVIMCSGKPNVVYNADGTINGEKSTFTKIDQGQAFRETTQSDGSKITVQGGIDRTQTFANAYKSGYLPFTFKEFLGTDPIETATASINLEGDTITPEVLRTAVISSNYSIADVYVTVFNAAGEEVWQKPIRVTGVYEREKEIGSAIMGSALKPYLDGTHKVKVDVQLYSGDRIALYEGTLVK